MHITNIPGHIPDVTDNISNDVVRQTLQEIGIEYLVSLPESLYEVLLEEVLKSSSMKLVQVCRESEGISISSGLTYGGKKVAMLCSYKGLYNSIDSLLGTAVRTQSSFLLLLSEATSQAKNAPKDLEEGLFTVDILKAIKIPYYEVRNNSEVPIIKEAWQKTRNYTKPVAVVLRW